jgi:hypothetical protein
VSTIARAIAFDIPRVISTSTGAIHRAAAIHLAVDAVSSDTNAGLNTDTARAHAHTGSDADTGCAGTNAWNDAHTACAHAIRLPDTALRRAVCVAVNSGFSR